MKERKKERKKEKRCIKEWRWKFRKVERNKEIRKKEIHCNQILFGN